MSNHEQEFDVIVIGAGMAGVAAARDLVASGKSVKILEARSRIGGRCCSVKFPSGHLIEVGAELIHGEHEQPLLQFAKEVGAKPMIAISDNVWRRADPQIHPIQLYRFPDVDVEQEFAIKLKSTFLDLATASRASNQYPSSVSASSPSNNCNTESSFKIVDASSVSFPPTPIVDPSILPSSCQCTAMNVSDMIEGFKLFQEIVAYIRSNYDDDANQFQ